jgi:hypothetical protein
MQYEVEFEIGDGDDQKETGVMIDIIHTGVGFSNTKAVVVLGNQSMVTKDIRELTVVDEAIGHKLLAIEEKHQKLDLPVDIVDG